MQNLRGVKVQVQVVAKDQIEDLGKAVVEEDVVVAEKSDTTAARAATKSLAIVAAKRVTSSQIARIRMRRVESAAKWAISKPCVRRPVTEPDKVEVVVAKDRKDSWRRQFDTFESCACELTIGEELPESMTVVVDVVGEAEQKIDKWLGDTGSSHH